MNRFGRVDGEDSPIRHKAKRRRVRSVMQELIYVAAHIYERALEKCRLLIWRSREFMKNYALDKVNKQNPASSAMPI